MIYLDKALLVIDMQKGSFTAQTPRHDTIGVIARINKLAERCRALKIPVIFIQHDGTRDGNFVPQTKEWENLEELIVEQQDILVDKYANDIFYNSRLQKVLKDLEISELLISGCATDFCVEATVQSALAKDYNVTVVKDAHTTGDRPHLSAVQVIEHYNWVWQNMIATKGEISVLSCQEILQKLT